MTDLSPEAQAIMDAWWKHSGSNQSGIAAALRVLVDEVVPQEDVAPRAEFDCEPRPSYNVRTGKYDGPIRHSHFDHLRLQFKQEELNFRWEQRQQTRALMLAIVTELETK